MCQSEQRMRKVNDRSILCKSNNLLLSLLTGSQIWEPDWEPVEWDSEGDSLSAIGRAAQFSNQLLLFLVRETGEWKLSGSSFVRRGCNGS